MFDTDAFVSECIACLDESEPRRAVRELLTRTMADACAVADRLRPEVAGITMLHHSPALTIIDVVWAPGMRIFAHDHRMWAAIGIYAGKEDNAFFRRPQSGAAGLVESGGKLLDTGDAALLGADTIHAVSNPSAGATGAIHVYGGDFVNAPRSRWLPPDLEEEPYDSAQTTDVFAKANAEWGSTS